VRLNRWLSNVLIWGGLALVIAGSVLAWPFVRDALQARSAAESLSFVVTLPSDLALPTATAALESVPADVTPAISATLTESMPTATAVTTAVAVPATALVPTTTVVPMPFVLPDNRTSSDEGTPIPTVIVPPPASLPPDRIVIKSIDLDAPVVTVGWHVEQGASVWDVPEWRAAGWLKTSAPAGRPGNTVLDGHHNIAGEVFRQLVDLKPRDEIQLHAGAFVYSYAVTERQILPERDQPLDIRIANARYIQPTQDERLTLITCWPYTNNTHRLIIVAKPIRTPRQSRE